eukprot:maker-scaffold308_size214241-snap-gene-1.47 protein:Tk09068 transcript:maker-scaffold308_size214241-snap-gene-1.47-mRNA-1 annotation:"transcription factor"
MGIGSTCATLMDASSAEGPNDGPESTLDPPLNEDCSHEESESDFETLVTAVFSSPGSIGSVQTFACPHEGCNSFFSKQGRLTTHLFSHTGERPFKCAEPECLASYTRMAHLTRHYDNQHTQQTIKCPQCVLEFNSKHSLKKHTRHVHEDPLRIHCSYCGQAFLKKNLLLKHSCPAQTQDLKDRHGDELAKEAKPRPHVCESCGKAFTFPNKLRIHQKSHLPKGCDLCSMEFPTMTLLRRHKSQSHAPSRLHSCNVCQKAFKCPSLLREHEHIHRGEAFMCPAQDCDREYAFFRNLRQHVYKRHGDEDLGDEFKMKKACKLALKCDFPGCSRVILNHRSFLHHQKLHEVKADNIYRSSKPKKASAPRSDKGRKKKAIASILTNLEVDPNVQRDLLNDKEIVIDPLEIEAQFQIEPNFRPATQGHGDTNETSGNDLCGKVHLRRNKKRSQVGPATTPLSLTSQ